MTSQIKYKPAGFIRRLFAMFYDAILVLALLFVASAISVLVNGGKTAGESSLLIQVLISAWLILVAFFYYGISWTVSGQTLGLRTWHMRVLNEAGEAISWPQAWVRFMVGIPGALLFFWMLFNKDKKALHDIASKSMVLDERKKRK